MQIIHICMIHIFCQYNGQHGKRNIHFGTVEIPHTISQQKENIVVYLHIIFIDVQHMGDVVINLNMIFRTKVSEKWGKRFL